MGFAKDYQAVVIQVNLTVLLVLATFFVGLSRTLPTTAYAKMIDIWMIFCMLNPFFEVLLHALSQALIREWDNDLEQRFSDETMTKLETLLMLLWKLLGCLALAFVFFYWTIALLP